MSQPSPVPVLVCALMVASCSLRRAMTQTEALGVDVARVDAAWNQRRSNGLAPVHEALDAARTQWPEAPALRWREVRLMLAEAWRVESELERIAALSEAKAEGQACLELDPAFVQSQVSGGWEQAIESIKPEFSECAAWSTWAWLQWIAAFDGAAASVDLAVVDGLRTRLETFEGSRDLWPSETWMDGLLLAVRPEWDGRDPERARQLLLKASEDVDEPSLPLVDIVLFAVNADTPETSAKAHRGICELQDPTPAEGGARRYLEEVEVPTWKGCVP